MGLQEIVETLLKPFQFASKNDFARLNSLKELGPLVIRLSDEGLKIEPDGLVAAAFLELKGLFLAFDKLDEADKRGRIESGLKLLERISSLANGVSGIDGAITPDILQSLKSQEESPKKGQKRVNTPLNKSKAQEKLIKEPKTAKKPPQNAKIASQNEKKSLKTPIIEIKGIGPGLEKKLIKKGISTVEDLLYYIPIRYEDRRDIKKIRELIVGSSGITLGEVMLSGASRYGRRRLYEVAITDGTGILVAKWFNFKQSYMDGLYKKGRKVLLYGPVTAYGAKKEMLHPDVEFLGEKDETVAVDIGGVVPVYSQIENLHQKTIRKILRRAVNGYAQYAESGLPDFVRRSRSLMDNSAAFIDIHKAGSSENSMPDPVARRSLVFDELFSLELGLGLKRENIGLEAGLGFLPKKNGLVSKLLKNLPFKPTGAQTRVFDEISKDMAAPHPMHRLLQGDVGSGKTLVSLMAALRAIDCGYQAAIMAPTEILAEQHFLNIKSYIEPLGIETVLLKGGLRAKERSEKLAAIADGTVSLIIGTHALIQRDVDFFKLGLAVVDEQHRFGVLQRAAIQKKSQPSDGAVDADDINRPTPDILLMTATPIPRTLAMTIFGEMDVSIIDEMPPGRTPVETTIMREKQRKSAYVALKKEIKAGGQAYIVYPLVEESEELPLLDATRMRDHLASDVFPDYKVALLHGRMKSEEKEAVMAAFKAGESDILVATTVIEVGVDVPNASLMIIEHAERFGLAQLHQLRGRVGRGERASRCILLAQWTKSDDALRRLKVMEETTDGFIIAEADLEIRGPGNFLGARQSGLPDFRLKETLTDLNLLKSARADAVEYLKSADRAGPEWERVTRVMRDRWQGRLELAGVG